MRDDGKKPNDSTTWQFADSLDSPANDQANNLANDQTNTMSYDPNTANADNAPYVDDQSNAEDYDADEDKITWTASEYLAHDKTILWYAVLAGAAVVLAALVFLVTRDKISTGVILLAGITLGIFAARKPHVLTYELNEQGIRIAGKPYDYSLFKSFTIIQNSGVPSVELMPLKRFMPPLTIYFDPQDADTIIEVMTNFLPHEQREIAMVDRLMHRLRF